MEFTTKELLLKLLPGFIILLGDVPYMVRVWQRKIKINVTSWILWSAISGSLLLNYSAAESTENIWALRGTCTGVVLITFIFLLRKRGTFRALEPFEWLCALLCVGSIVLFFVEKGKDYSLYFSLSAEICATIPTIVFVWKNPLEDRPFNWIMFALGYTDTFFSLPDTTDAKNLALPIIMIMGSLIIAFPLIRHRLQNSIPFFKWI